MNSTENFPRTYSRLGAGDACFRALVCWYLTGLLTSIGFSFGFYLVKPARRVVPEPIAAVDALSWQDGKWYRQIATDGYQYDPGARSNAAFFPVYPLLGRALMKLTGLRAEVALLLVSNLSFAAALVALALYARDRYPDAHRELVDSTLLAAVLFPTGCFFRLVYSESTFLLLTVFAMYGMRRRWPLWQIGLIVGLASAARPVGIALLAPFAIYVSRCRGKSTPALGSATEQRAPLNGAAIALRGRYRPLVPRLALYPFACWGLLAFMVYQYVAFGDFLAAFKSHAHWRVRGGSWLEKASALATFEPVRSVYDSASPAFWASYDEHGIAWLSLQFANPFFFVAAIGLMALGAWRRWLSHEETWLGALLIFIPYVGRGFEMGMGAMGRFVVVAFPIYLVLGNLSAHLPTWLRGAIAALSGALLACYTALYAARFPVF